MVHTIAILSSIVSIMSNTIVIVKNVLGIAQLYC